MAVRVDNSTKTISEPASTNFWPANNPPLSALTNSLNAWAGSGNLTTASVGTFGTAATNASGDFTPIAHVSATNNPHAVSASQVGLGSVENTALSTWGGSTNTTTLGTITTGAWQGSTIAGSYLPTATTNAPGIIQIATDIEIQTGTDSGKSAPPSGLAAWWTWIKTQAQTFTGVMTFSSGVTMTEQTIASSTTPTWDVNAGMNAQFTATNAATFTVTNMVAGQAAALAITQSSGTNGYVMTFPAGVKQAFGGNNTYTMSGTNAVDILYFRKTGTNTVIEGVVPGITP
jgi:hypothetical protein